MLNIIQITDCHLFSDISKLGYNEVNPFNSLQLVLEQVKLADIDWIIVTGDISADGSEQSYQNFMSLIRQLNLSESLLVIAGNHDNLAHMQKHFPAKSLCLHRPHFAIADNWHVHLLHTPTATSIGHISTASLNALEEYLTDHSDGYHLIAVHHHPISCGGWMDKHEWQNRQTFTATVADHPAVKGVIYGHIHTASEIQQAHCLYMACPATCWQFATQDTFALSPLQPGYRVINLTKNGQINTTVHRLTE